MGSMRHEFRIKNLLFEYKKQQRFRTSRCGSGILYIIYRTILMLFFVSSFIYVLIDWDPPQYAFIFLTIWSFIILIINMVLLWISSILYMIPKKKQENDAPKQMDKFTRIVWIFYNLTLSSSPLVTLIYWMILSSDVTTIEFSNITIHGVNTIATLLDLIIGAVPIRILHFWLVAVYALLYGIFSGIYWAAGGTDPDGGCCIYPVFDWGTHPGASIGWLIIMIVISIIIHIVLFLFSKLIKLLLQKIKTLKSTQEAPQSEMNVTTIA